MNLKVYTCSNCDTEFASKKDPKAEMVHDRPQCSNCGSRDFKR